MKKKHERKQAVALSYEAARDTAPKIAASGKGLIAEKIIERARENNIPIQEDPSLVALLGQLNINEKIPEDLYQAVAEVFAFVYRIDQKLKEKQ